MKKVLHLKLNNIQRWGIGCGLIGLILIFFNELVEYLNRGNAQYPGILGNILKNYSPNVSTDLIFIAFSIFILNHLYQQEAEKREKRDLIFRMGSANNVVATEAARRLKNGDFWMVSLEGERFDGADLSGADLKNVNLKNTDLMNTNLTEAKMENANLEGAVVIDTILKRAVLRNTNFKGAKIRSTKKEFHIFEGANLYCANFMGAIFSVLKEDKLVEDESIELRHADRLNHATMPDGKRYDGRYKLPGDMNQPGVDINDDNCMANFYGVTLEDYQIGQKWFMENLFSSRYGVFLSCWVGGTVYIQFKPNLHHLGANIRLYNVLNQSRIFGLLIRTKGFQMAKPEITPKHLVELSEDNRKYFNEYQLKSSDPPGYFYRVEEFLQFVAFLNAKATQDINIDDIDTYKQEMKSSKYTNTTISGRLSAIAGFRDFLHINHPDQFGDKFLIGLPKHERSLRKKWEGRILCLEEISLIRKYNRQVSRSPIRDSVIFELFYQLGLDKQFVENLVFNEDDLRMHPQLDDLVKKVRPEDISTSVINSYFERITKYLISEGVYLGGDKKIISYDITNSHDANFITCPNCGRVFECTEKNWCFARIEFDEDFHLVCIVCKGKRNEN